MSIGGGGGLLGAIGGIVGSVFGGPIGAMIGQMIGQLVQQVAGQLLQQVGQELGNVSQQAQQAGQDILRDALGGNNGNNSASMDAGSMLNNFLKELGGASPQTTADAQNGLQDLQKAMTDLIRAIMQEVTGTSSKNRGGKDGGNSVGNGVGGTTPGGISTPGGADDSSGDDFFIAIAKALGNALQKQADKVKTLADKVSQDSTDGGEQGDKQLQKDQTLLSAESQKLAAITQSVQTAISSIGGALRTAAEKN